MAVRADIGGETETIVRLAETRIIRAAQEDVDRGTVTIGGPEVAQRIKHQPEGIDLAPGMLLDMGAVDLEPITIPRIHLDGAAIAGGEGGVVIVTMVGVEPAVETTPEIAFTRCVS